MRFSYTLQIKAITYKFHASVITEYKGFLFLPASKNYFIIDVKTFTWRTQEELNEKIPRSKKGWCHGFSTTNKIAKAKDFHARKKMNGLQ